MKPAHYLLCLLLTAASAPAQDSTVSLRHMPRTVVKLAPLSLLDQDATVQAGLEYRVAPMMAVQAEVGYGWKGLSLFTSDLDKYTNAEVWRVRGEVRFYRGRYRTNRRRGIAVRSNFPLGNYWAIDGLFKQINVIKQDNLYSAEAASQIGSYVVIGTQQRPISRYVLGSHLKIGRQFAFYDPQQRVFSRTLLDIYFGAGVRWAINDVPPPPFNPTPTCGCGIGRSFTDRDSQVAPSLTAGMKLGFVL